METFTKEIKVIQEAILEGNYEEGERLFQETGISRDKENYSDIVAILDASIAAYFGDRDRMWEAIQKGLSVNCKNYELYVMLGNYYLEENLNQAYLCYENALHYCDVKEDYLQIKNLADKLCQEYQIHVNKAAFVILSYNLLDYTKLCIEGIRATVPETAREIIVVDNASEDGSVEWLRQQRDIKLRENPTNMGFPVGCNQGIAMAEKDSDIFLLNNDTLMPENALFWLRMGLYSGEDVGSAGSVSNFVGNFQQVAGEITDIEKLLEYGKNNNLPMKHPYERKLFLIGFALLIKRNALDQVGVLDERFTPGNSEDVDYGLRLIKVGYKNILCRNSFIIHFGSKSFQKLGKEYGAVLKANRQKIDEKWGLDIEYYMWPRTNLVKMVNEPTEHKFRILDIGCGCGAMLGYIKGLYPATETYGIELNPIAAEFAQTFGEIICADVEKLQMPWPEEFFDYVVMGDVLEHLHKPELVLQEVYKILKPGGHIIVSMPNVKHFSVLLPLLTKDVFPYADAGILDTTHLKMYTGTEIKNLIERCGFTIEKLSHTTSGTPNQQENRLINQLMRMMEKPDITVFLAYQYLVRAIKVS